MNNNLNIMIQSKDEYINKFVSLTLKHFIDGFKSIYENVKNKNKESKYILKELQSEIRLIPQWSQNILDKEYNRIKAISKCEYFDNLIEAIFVSYSQMLILVNNKNKNFKVKVPTSSYVIHKCYISLARILWKNPHLLYHRYDNKKQRENYLQLEKLFNSCIHDTIRDLLPYKELVSNYLENKDLFNNDHLLSDYDTDSNNSSDDEIIDDFEQHNQDNINNKDNLVNLSEDFIDDFEKITNDDLQENKEENEE